MALRPEVPDYPPTARHITGLLMAMGALKSKSMMALLLASSVNETQPLTLSAAISGTDTIYA